MWIQPLLNRDDSCYMDTAMIALFLRPSRALKKIIGNSRCSSPGFENICGGKRNARRVQEIIRHTARELADHSAMSEETVDLAPLRLAAKNCPSLNRHERFDREGMNDPSVFLEYIFALFPCLKMTVRRISTCCRHCDAQISLDEKVNPLVYLETGPLKDIDGMMLSDVVDLHEENTNTRFMSPSFIVFDITRLSMRGRYLHDIEVTPDRSIALGRRTLHLRAIVVWRNHHYTVYAKTGHVWYYFDDMEDTVEKIGSYEDMIEDDDGFATMDGKLFVYGA